MGSQYVHGIFWLTLKYGLMMTEGRNIMFTMLNIVNIMGSQYVHGIFWLTLKYGLMMTEGRNM